MSETILLHAECLDDALALARKLKDLNYIKKYSDQNKAQVEIELDNLKVTMKTDKITKDKGDIVSFRAECLSDVSELISKLSHANIQYSYTINNLGEYGDVKVELMLKSITINELFDYMQKVEDGHVMYQSLRALPLEKNSLERRNNCNPPEDWKV